MKKVAGLAHSGGCNVLTTIHQPSSEVFHSFDKARAISPVSPLYLPCISLQVSAEETLRLIATFAYPVGQVHEK